MDSLLPVFLCFVLPLLWTIAVFVAGRWSATHKIAVQRLDTAPSPYYENFEQER